MSTMGRQVVPTNDHVTTKHPDYLTNTERWRRCRDVEDGEDAVKSRGEPYLPKLEGQEVKEYESYKARALFYNATSRTIQAVLGAVFRKKPVITPPNETFDKSVVNAYDEILKIGRFGILVDVPREGGDPYPVEYRGEQIINWHYATVGDAKVLDLVVLEEVVTEFDHTTFSTKSVKQYRVLELVYPRMEFSELAVEEEEDEESTERIYKMTLWRSVTDPSTRREIFEIVSVAFPTMRGDVLGFIPFKIINTTNCDPDIEKPPLLDLIAVNLSHYRTSADLEHGRHFTALPTAWVAGFPTDTELRVGSGTAWVTDNVAAKAGFLEFTGQGLKALETAMEQKEHLMAVMGARLFESSKHGVEAAETVRLRQSADTATAAQIANNISRAYSELYTWYLMFQLTPEAQVGEVVVNTDILDTAMDAGTMTSLVSAWQQGAISQDTMLYNLKKGEVLPPDRSEEQEKSLVDQDLARMQALIGTQNDNPPDQ